jgi:hypothetical protein
MELSDQQTARTSVRGKVVSVGWVLAALCQGARIAFGGKAGQKSYSLKTCGYKLP